MTRTNLLRTLKVVAAVLAALEPISPLRAQSSDSAANRGAAESQVAGQWVAPSQNVTAGDMTLILQLWQKGDSVRGFAHYEQRGLTFGAQTALFGTLKGGRLVLQDLADTFLLEGRLRNGKLDTLLSRGSGRKSESFPSIFTRQT